MTNTLYLAEDEYICDGCSRVISAGEQHLSGIESCCGGCYRSLCRGCVLYAVSLLHSQDGWGRETMTLMSASHIDPQC